MNIFKSKIKSLKFGGPPLDINLFHGPPLAYFELENDEDITEDTLISISDKILLQKGPHVINIMDIDLKNYRDDFLTLYDFLTMKTFVKKNGKYIITKKGGIHLIQTLLANDTEVEFNNDGNKENYEDLISFLDELTNTTYPVFKFYKNKGHVRPTVMLNKHYAPAEFLQIIQKLMFFNDKSIIEDIKIFKRKYPNELYLILKLSTINKLYNNQVLIDYKNINNIIYHLTTTYFELLNKISSEYSASTLVTNNISKDIVGITKADMFQIFAHGNNYGFDHDNDDHLGSKATPLVTLHDFINSLPLKSINYLSTLYCNSFKDEQSFLKAFKKFKIVPNYSNYSLDTISEYATLLYLHGFILSQELTTDYSIMNDIGLLTTFAFNTTMPSRVEFYEHVVP